MGFAWSMLFLLIIGNGVERAEDWVWAFAGPGDGALGLVAAVVVTAVEWMDLIVRAVIVAVVDIVID